MSSDSRGNSKLRMIHCYYRTCTLLALVAAVSTYNLDVSRAKIFSDPNAASSRRSSYFGYSVALYVHQNVSLLLVGAPRANSSRRADKNDRVFEPGAVYYCDLSNDKCTEWLLDASPNNTINYKSGIQQNRNSAWIGATVVVENSTSPRVAVCAPLWKAQGETDYERRQRFFWRPNGMCYGINATNPQSILADSVQSTSRHFPLIDTNHQREIDDNLNYAFGEAGFSAHIVPNFHRLVVGAPGFYENRGSIIVLKDDKDTNTFDATVVSDTISDNRFDFEGYLGYSITCGKFFNNYTFCCASGAPRNKDFRGKVYIYCIQEDKKSNALKMDEFKGVQFGEYFGSSLAACDVNGDGKDDLIVGSPLWSGDIEEGRVYAYVSKYNKLSWNKQHIKGERPYGRFGSSLACLGDLDHDGFQDVAVGAPYEDDGRGAIYIYSGSGDRDLFLKPSQRIVAKDLSLALWGFGHSLSEPARDVNGDGYPDLAVGSFMSRHAVLLPSKAIIKVTVNLRRLANSSLSFNSTHLAFEACAKYNGAYAPDTFDANISIILFEIFWYGETPHTNSYQNVLRALKPETQHCEEFYIPRNGSLKNILNMVRVNVNITCGHDDSSHNKCPMFHPKSKTTDSMQAYARDCGSDELCITDLKVNITSNNLSPNNSYTIGSGINVNVTILVENTNEPAYLPEAHIFIPEPITLVKKPPNCETSPRTNEMLKITCQLQNPLRQDNTDTVLVELNMDAIQSTERLKKIEVTVTSHSKEKSLDDNYQSLIINFAVDADLQIIGKSQGNQYSYVENEVDEKNVKHFNFYHIYEILELGITPIQEAVLFVSVPMRFQDFDIANISYDSKYNCSIMTSSVEAHNYYDEKDNFFMNCTNPDVTCQHLRCDFGSYLKTTATEFIISIDFHISEDIVVAAQWKNITYVSQAYVEIVTPSMAMEVTNKTKHFSQVSTEIFRRHYNISILVIVLSILCGILLLEIIGFVLYKFGFFKRNRRKDTQTSNPTSEQQENKGELEPSTSKM